MTLPPGPTTAPGRGGTSEEVAQRGPSRAAQGRGRSLLVSALGVCVGGDPGHGESFVLPWPDEQHRTMKTLRWPRLDSPTHGHTPPHTQPLVLRRFLPPHVSARLGRPCSPSRAPAVTRAREWWGRGGPCDQLAWEGWGWGNWGRGGGLRNGGRNRPEVESRSLLSSPSPQALRPSARERRATAWLKKS